MFVSIICVTCALALSITSAFTFLPVQIWYDFWKPLVMLIAGYIAGIAICWIFYDINGRIMSSYKKKYERPSNWARFLLTQGMWYIDFHANIKLKKIGLEKALNKHGVQDGDTLIVGGREFEWNGDLDEEAPTQPEHTGYKRRATKAERLAKRAARRKAKKG